MFVRPKPNYYSEYTARAFRSGSFSFILGAQFITTLVYYSYVSFTKYTYKFILSALMLLQGVFSLLVPHSSLSIIFGVRFVCVPALRILYISDVFKTIRSACCDFPTEKWLLPHTHTHLLFTILSAMPPPQLAGMPKENAIVVAIV